MDAQLSYVALTRHRDDVRLYASHEDFRNSGEMIEQMTRDRLQDSTALYRESYDYQDVVSGFAERRGFPTSQVLVDFVKSNLAYLRERFDRLAAAFDRLRKPAPDHDLRDEAIRPRRDTPAPTPRMLSSPPDLTPQLSQSMARLSHSLASETLKGRKARGFERSAHYELNMAGSASELRGFNEVIRLRIGGEAVLSHGSHQPAEDAAILRGQPEAWSRFARENWDAIFAAQWAETQAGLQPLTAKTRSNNPERRTRTAMSEEQKPERRPLIEAMPELPPLTDRALRERAIADKMIGPTKATASDVAGRIYTNGDAAVVTIAARYAELGNASAVLSEVERAPANFGDLKGGTRLGIANAERRNALEWVPQMAVHAGKMLEMAGRAETVIAADHDARRVATAKPLPDLSENAQHFLARVDSVSRQTIGESKLTEMSALLNDTSSIQEVQSFRRALSERYGRGHGMIREGIAEYPGFKRQGQAEREVTMTRVNSVLSGFSQIDAMRTQVKTNTRDRHLGKDQGRGIER
jgi:hypothetical protein